MLSQAAPMSPAALLTLKQRVLRAGAWTLCGYGLTQAIRLGSSLVMTRLLAPEMFGVMAVAMTLTAILSLLCDFGVNANIVQSRRGEDPLFLDTAWVVQIVRAFLVWVCALLVGVALYLANSVGMIPAQSVYSSSSLPPVIAASAFSIVILGFQSTRIATALRRFDQKRLVSIELLSQIGGLVVMMSIAAPHPSVWALVWGGLAASLMTTVLSHTWTTGHRNRFRWEREAARDVLRFGKWIFASSALYVLATNGDRLLLAAFVDADLLGLYGIAALIIGAVEAGIYRFFSAVSLPALSEVARNNPAKLREMYYRLRVPADVVLLALAGALFAAGQVVIDTLYDARYAGAGSILQVLGLSLVFSRYLVVLLAYVAIGLPRYQTLVNVVRLISLYTVVPVLYQLGGAEGAIWGIALHALAAVPFVYLFNIRVGINDFRLESLVLVALPAGYVSGLALCALVR